MAEPGARYTGKLKIEGGPVPIKVWKDKDRKGGPKGDDLRSERKGIVGSHPT